MNLRSDLYTLDPERKAQGLISYSEQWSSTHYDVDCSSPEFLRWDQNSMNYSSGRSKYS